MSEVGFMGTAWQRFRAKFYVAPNGCWIWIGGKSHGSRGAFWFEGKDELAHNAAFIVMAGSKAPDMDRDHLCRNGICANPFHLEQVTPIENAVRYSHDHGPNPNAPSSESCPHHHVYTIANMYRIPSKPNKRQCRACMKIRNSSEYRQAKDKATREALLLNPASLYERPSLRGVSLANLQRNKTHCPYNHEYTEANIYRGPNQLNSRVCRTCLKIRKSKAYKIAKLRNDHATCKKLLLQPAMLAKEAQEA